MRVDTVYVSGEKDYYNSCCFTWMYSGSAETAKIFLYVFTINKNNFIGFVEILKNNHAERKINWPLYTNLPVVSVLHFNVYFRSV